MKTKSFLKMSEENLDSTEIEDDDDMPDPEDEQEDEGDEYEIDIDEALSKDIKGNKEPSPEKIDKALRLGFDVPIPDGFNPTKPAVSI